MNYWKMFQELTYAATKVMIYRLLFPDDLTFMSFGRWLSLEYDNAKKTWLKGNKELEEKGYLVDGQWTKKAIEVVKGKNERDGEEK